MNLQYNSYINEYRRQEQLGEVKQAHYILQNQPQESRPWVGSQIREWQQTLKQIQRIRINVSFEVVPLQTETGCP